MEGIEKCRYCTTSYSRHTLIAAFFEFVEIKVLPRICCVAINSDTNMIGRLGRPSLNLIDVICKDLAHKNIDNKLR